MNTSASKIGDFDTCSLLFYYKDVLGLPDRVHPKTKTGSLVHKVFELLMAKKRRELQESVFRHGFFIEDYPAVKRFIVRWCRREKIDYDFNDIGDMLDVAFKGIREFFLPRAYIDYFTEQRFEIDDEGKTVGIIDLLIVYKDRLVVVDLKSKAQKFTRSDLPDNIQAALYQWYCWKKYNLPATVRFIMVRHGPTTRTPDKHLQIVEPKTQIQLLGLDILTKNAYPIINNFTFADALSHVCTNRNFCEHICSYRKPFDYWEKNGRKVLEDTGGDKHRHLGCIRFNQG